MHVSPFKLRLHVYLYNKTLCQTHLDTNNRKNDQMKPSLEQLNNCSVDLVFTLKLPDLHLSHVLYKSRDRPLHHSSLLK